ncbi:MAG: oligosaccharide flippase family protein [Clostridia bacterium]|nr:oligosaccharide flippase family protein [Clostridia bacterium]
MKKKRFIKNAVILTAVSLFMRAVSFSFNVYIANKISSSGVGLFALIMSVYNFGVTFSASGINLASTKVISEEIAQHKDTKAAVRKSLLYALFFGSAAFLLIYFGAQFFANIVVGDARIELPLKILSVSLPCVAMSFALSGYFTATGKVYKNAIVQVIEQMIRIAGAVLLLNIGEITSAQSACISLVLSGCAAEIISFLILYIVYKTDYNVATKTKSHNLKKRIMRYGLPVAISAYIRSALSTTEHTLIPKSLTRFSGDKEVALSAYGVVHGMVMPLVFLPSGVVGSVATLLIPEITMLNSLKNYKKIDNLIERILFLTLTFSIGIAGILYFFSEEIGMLFYKSEEAAYFLKQIAPLTAIMYADGVVDAVLKGLNQEVHAMRYDIVLSAVSIVLICTLIPVNGISGYITIIYISEMLNSYLSINRLMEVSNFKIRPLLWTVIPATGVFLSCFISKNLIQNSTLSLAACGAIYCLLMFLYKHCVELYKRKPL